MPKAKDDPRQRLLDTAARLFYSEGIHTVPVDRLVTEAGVTRSTFYRHFPAKEDLVVAYLRAIDATLRASVADVASRDNAAQGLDDLLELIGSTICADGFRGCHFINAAAEYPDASDEVRKAIAEHRAWFQETATAVADRAGHPDPAHVGRSLVILHDGALSGAQLDDPESVRRTFLRASRAIIRQTTQCP
ncbi:TetR/AcrR family transcriptional regulator [Amycolatopsis sp. NPDC051061]|uniref:TetR/AcrR family transcriptional regulator n=1 Tax=Amycolatopsis sp. NPDC051061 TaxID=3155042 RepID=UPI003449D679